MAHKQAIVSLTERKSGLVLVYKVDRRTKENTEVAIKRLLNSVSDKVHTITSDNGKEFGNHEKIAKGLKCSFYFAHAYSSWERGTNENTNGLIRQYFLKNRDFRTITDKGVDPRHEKTQQSSKEKIWVQNTQSGIFWRIIQCCTYYLNPAPNIKYQILFNDFLAI